MTEVPPQRPAGQCISEEPLDHDPLAGDEHTGSESTGGHASRKVAVAGARGSSLTVLGSSAGMGLQFISVAVLARLLTPEDFGLIAMVGVFVSLGGLIRDFGMPTAALQAKSLSRQQASNLFWVNTGLATTAAVLLASSTPLLVDLYSEPRLGALVPALASVILITGIGAQVQVDLARRMKYKTLVVTDISSQAIALAVAIVMALLGAGYWALVAQSLVTAIVTLVSRLVASRWIPTRFRRGYDSRGLFRAGAEYGSAQLLTFVQNNADTLLVGSIMGAVPLGYYNRAYQLLTAPVSRLLDPLTQVVIPTLNRGRAEGADPYSLLLRMQFAAGGLVVWIFMVAAASADHLIPLLLGPDWQPTIRVFQILAIGGAIWVFSYVSYWVFIYSGQSRQLLRYNLVSKPLAVGCLAVGSFFGIDGVAWGYVAAMAISWPMNLIWLSRTAKIKAKGFAWNGILLLVAAAIGGTLAVIFSSAVPGLPSIINIVVTTLIATIVMFGLLCIVSDGRRQLLQSRELVKLVLHRESATDGGDELKAPRRGRKSPCRGSVD